MTNDQLKALAQRGAALRYAEIQAELSALVATFPDLSRVRDSRTPNGRPRMSAAQRKAISARMTAYWAKRRKAAKKGR